MAPGRPLAKEFAEGRGALIGSGVPPWRPDRSLSFLSEGPYRSSRPDTDQRVFLHKLAIGHLAASKRHHQGMLPLAVVLSDLGDLLLHRHPSMWLANQRDDTLRAGIAYRAPAGNLNTLGGGRNFRVRQHERRWTGASHRHALTAPMPADDPRVREEASLGFVGWDGIRDIGAFGGARASGNLS
jgi:hypothetical protein